MASSTGSSSSSSIINNIANGLRTQLFGPAGHLIAPAFLWTTSNFKQVDDSVRGGSSQSHVALTPGGSNRLKFSGFLDTTTLGGAGFASQQYTPPAGSHVFPIQLTADQYQGLELHIWIPTPTHAHKPAGPTTATSNTTEGKPGGGGRAPVSSYTLNLYTTEQKRRPDGRAESRLSYEWNFQPGKHHTSQPTSSSDGHIDIVRSKWSGFKATYRGRPQPDAPELRPEEIKAWSLMARSDFGEQSGEFSLEVDSLWATKVTKEKAATTGFTADEKSGAQQQLSSRRELVDDEKIPFATTAAEQRRDPMAGARGFALYVFSTLLLFAWVVWALCPDRWLHAAGITWYPSRQWAYLIPAWSMIAVLFVYAAYMGINVAMTPAPGDVSTLTDHHARLPFPNKVPSQYPDANAAAAAPGSTPLPLLRARDMNWHEARAFYLEHARRLGEGQPGMSDMPDVYDLPPSVAHERAQRRL